MDRCEECGFVYAAVARGRLPGEIRGLPRQFGERLRAANRAGSARTRVPPRTWSTLEYACHVRDVLRVQRQRVRLTLAEDRPTFASMRRDERAVEERYNEQDPDEVLAELEATAEALAESLASLSDEQWARTGVYNWPEPAERSLTWIARHTVHEGIHHLGDIDAIIGGTDRSARMPSRPER
ncbi:MAG: DinB family protein [Egibacteraceae bacterium]